MLSKRISKLLLTGAVVGGMAGAANAALNIDIRATGVTGAGAQLVNSKSVTGVTNGSVVSFDVFAVVTGTNANFDDDNILSVSGSWRSSNGGLLGNIAPVARAPLFNGLGSSVGLAQDLDLDGDLDVGSNNDGAAANFWGARFVDPAGSPAGLPNGGRIGFGTFTVTNASNGTGQTTINFDGRNAATAANYFQDGASVAEASQDGAVGLTIVGTPGGVVPEPATLSLAGLAGLAMVRRRRA